MALLEGVSVLSLFGQASGAASVNEAKELQPAHGSAEPLDPIANAATVHQEEDERIA